MVKKIYDIIPPKVKAKTAKASATKSKARKPRKKVLSEVVLTPPVTEVDTLETPAPKAQDPSALIKDFKIQPISPLPDAPEAPASSQKMGMDEDLAMAKASAPIQPASKSSAQPIAQPKLYNGGVSTPPPLPKPNPILMLPAKTVHHVKRHFMRWLVVLLLIILVGVGGYLYVALPKATITVTPKTQTVAFQDNVSIDKSLSGINVEKKIIPGRVVVTEKQDTQEFWPTGIASGDVKASGKITIYNNISPASSFSLKAGTHFLSDSGKYFVTLEKVTIPAATGSKGKMTPGSVDVNVQAEEAGPDSNIKPAKFSVPKLSGTAYYYTIWADSKDAMTGGFSGSVKKVIKSDLDQAKETLTEKLFNQAQDELAKSLSDDEVLLSSALVKNMVDASADVKVDAVVEKFNETVKVKVSGLVFKKSDLALFTKNDLANHVDEGKTVLEKSVNTSYVAKNVDVTKGTAELEISTSLQEYKKVGEDVLSDMVLGKNAEEIQQVIGQAYDGQVSQLNIDFWPFWVSRVPNDKTRVEVEVIFE